MIIFYKDRKQKKGVSGDTPFNICALLVRVRLESLKNNLTKLFDRQLDSVTELGLGKLSIQMH
jgi:hypothetical protein